MKKGLILVWDIICVNKISIIWLGFWIELNDFELIYKKIRYIRLVNGGVLIYIVFK